MLIIFEQFVLLFLFIFCGWLLGKTGIIKHEHSKILSTLCVYLFLPCSTIKAFSSSFSIENIKNYYPLLIVSVILILLLSILTFFTVKLLSKDNYEKKVLFYAIVVPNYGYMGYALAEGIFGINALLDMIIFGIPFSVFCYTVGFCILTGSGFSFKRLLNPALLSVIVGIVLGIFQIQLPNVVNSFIDKGSSCMAPVSMLLAGITISEFSPKKLINDKRAYLVSTIRLFIIPISVYLLLKPICSDNIVKSAVLLCAMPCGLNTIVFPKLVGEDCTVGAKLAFVSNILALGTIPFVLHFI